MSRSVLPYGDVLLWLGVIPAVGTARHLVKEVVGRKINSQWSGQGSWYLYQRW